MKTSMRNFGFGLIALLSMSVASAAHQSGQGTPPAPRVISGKLGEWVGAGPALYKVISYESGLHDYRERFNQAGKTIHPGFSKDRLAVIIVEIKNTTDHAIFPPLFIPALTDTDGVRTTEWKLDTRQTSFVTEHPRDMRDDSLSPAEIAPGQALKLALVFSISPKATPTYLEFAPENFRDMPFGRSRYQPGTGGATPAGGQIGPRSNAVRRPVRDVVHVLIDLVPKSH
jgi:hypothetical protein